MKKNGLFPLLLAACSLCACGNQTSFSMIQPYSCFSIGQTSKDEAGNSIVVNSLKREGDDFIVNIDLHCNKGSYVSFYYQVQEIEGARFDIDASEENNKSRFYTGGTIWLTKYDMYFTGFDLLSKTETYHIDFGVVETGFACTYFAFSLSDFSSLSF